MGHRIVPFYHWVPSRWWIRLGMSRRPSKYQPNRPTVCFCPSSSRSESRWSSKTDRLRMPRRAVSFSREGEASAEPVRNLGEMKRLGRSLALPNPVKMREFNGLGMPRDMPRRIEPGYSKRNYLARPRTLTRGSSRKSAASPDPAEPGD
jgi:hypothetical protein